jgi:hypothetical protein
VAGRSDGSLVLMLGRRLVLQSCRMVQKHVLGLASLAGADFIVYAYDNTP